MFRCFFSHNAKNHENQWQLCQRLCYDVEGSNSNVAYNCNSLSMDLRERVRTHMWSNIGSNTGYLNCQAALREGIQVSITCKYDAAGKFSHPIQVRMRTYDSSASP
jgi:hypothetical protein